MIAVAIAAPVALPHVAHEFAGDLLDVRKGPSSDHLLGTDTLGRDVLDRLLVGARVTMIGVAEALLVVLALGVPIGLAAGFFGGWIDNVVTWLADLTFSVPAIVIVIIVLTVFPQSMLAAMCALGVVAAPGLMRVVRAATLPVREEAYVAAARVSGLSTPYIMARHVLPRITGPIVVQASFLCAVALLTQTGLAFLGLLVAPPAPSWGGMVAEGVSVLELQPWLIWPAGMAIALTVLALGLLGDGVRDASTEHWSLPVARPRRTRIPRVASLAPPTEPQEPARELVLALEHLKVSIATPTERIALVDDITLDIAEGESVGIVGESGCGKTITALAILRLLPAGASIDGGSIVFNNRDLTHLSEHDLRQIRGKEIGFIAQEALASLDPAFRVGTQLVEAVQRHQRVSRRAAEARALELLRRVRLADAAQVARRYPHQLSGGMAQRVSIARALAGEPRLLIADEPTTALDVTVQAEILDLLRELQETRGMAILLVSHDWGVIASICDRAVVIYSGQVVERAELNSMVMLPLHPYTEALLASNPHNTVGGEVLPVIPGTVPRPGAWPHGCHFHPRCKYATRECQEVAIPLARVAPGRETRCIHYDVLEHQSDGSSPCRR